MSMFVVAALAYAKVVRWCSWTSFNVYLLVIIKVIGPPKIMAPKFDESCFYNEWQFTIINVYGNHINICQG
jgi:hypothetical protein